MFYSLRNRPPRRKFNNDDPSMTIRSLRDETDINVMMARYQKSGSFHGSTNIPSARPQFGDFSTLPDYQQAMQILLDANDSFSALPSSVRDRFANDPANMLEFLADENNKDEAIRLGLCVKPDSPPVAPAPPVVPTS